VVWQAGTLGVLTPRLNVPQMRALIRLGVILRWVAVAFAGLAGLLGPRVPNLLPAEILAAVIYNGLVMGAAIRAPDEAVPQIALVTTLIDQLFCFTFLGLYNVAPDSRQVAAYVPGMIEAVAFFGAAGAVLSSGIFLTGVVVVQATVAVLMRGPFDSEGIFGATMIVILIGTCLGAVSQVSGMASEDAVRGDGTVHSTAVPVRSGPSIREQEVLRMLAEGCSNAIIASRLGLSERRVKACVERLLTQLKARNRAEAVASAIRTGLL
jgi:DNA-binding CsgD family transcriptional regulator